MFSLPRLATITATGPGCALLGSSNSREGYAAKVVPNQSGDATAWHGTLISPAITAGQQEELIRAIGFSTTT
jgi:hypothetical protein